MMKMMKFMMLFDEAKVRTNDVDNYIANKAACKTIIVFDQTRLFQSISLMDVHDRLLLRV